MIGTLTQTLRQAAWEALNIRRLTSGRPKITSRLSRFDKWRSHVIWAATVARQKSFFIVKLHSSQKFVSGSIRHTSPIIQICSRFPLHSPDIVAAHWAGPRSTPQQNFYWGHNLYKSQVWFMSQLVRMLSPPCLVTELLLGNLQCPIFNFKLSSGLTISSCSCSWPVSGCHLERKLQCNNSQFLYQTS